MADHGLFGPQSMMWRVNGEAIVLLGGGRALLLQVAHPSVAAGVEEHSDYREDPWGRLSRTLDVTGRIVFGSSAEAARAARRLRAVHADVRGSVADGRTAGAAYDARDPQLGLWVWATLVETALLMYRRYVGPLKVTDVERYYDEQKRFLAACGVRPALAPDTFAGFMAWYDAMVEDVLEVTPAAQAVAVAVTRPPRLPLALRPAFDALNLVTIGLLPEALRAGYGFDWGLQRERLLSASARVSRLALPLLPALLRDSPGMRRATG